MATKKSPAVVTKEYANNDIIIASVIRKTFANGSHVDNLSFSMKNDKTGKFDKVDSLSNLQDFFVSMVELKKPVEFTSGDVKVGFIKMTPKKKAK
jgi:hypothetical protein